MGNPFQRLDTDLRTAATELHTVLETNLTRVANSVDAARVEYEELTVTVAKVQHELMTLSQRFMDLSERFADLGERYLKQEQRLEQQGDQIVALTAEVRQLRGRGGAS